MVILNKNVFSIYNHESFSDFYDFHSGVEELVPLQLITYIWNRRNCNL